MTRSHFLMFQVLYFLFVIGLMRNLFLFSVQVKVFVYSFYYKVFDTVNFNLPDDLDPLLILLIIVLLLYLCYYPLLQVFLWFQFVYQFDFLFHLLDLLIFESIVNQLEVWNYYFDFNLLILYRGDVQFEINKNHHFLYTKLETQKFP